MSEQPQDYECLREFVRRANQNAFAAIVRRHLDLVYGTAMRKVEDQGAAQEILQNVFTALARKAWQFAPDDSLPAWLHRTTLLESKQWLRGELRRRRREQTAAELGTTMKTSDEQPALRGLIPLLDEALLSLRERERTALLLRFYENRSFREVGASLGVGEDAAQKRVSSALDQLARFFQRRGFRTATVAATVATLQHTATAAPAMAAASVVQAALHLAPPFPGLSSFLARFAGLTKAQTAVLCMAITAAPVAWEWIQAHAAKNAAASSQSGLNDARAKQELLILDIERLRTESARLDITLAEAEQAQARNREGERKLAALKARLGGLVEANNSRSPDDLPYVRVPKSVVPSLDLMSMFGHSGEISDKALEVLGITPEEKLASEATLSNYWHGVDTLMSIAAYETNLTAGLPPGRLAKTVIVPPLGSDLKDLAQATRAQLTQTLGAERERILFGDWDQGAIQLFWPGNLWKISEELQTFTVWTGPAATNTGGPAFGATWSSIHGGTSTEGTLAQARTGWEIFPKPILGQFFEPWLRRLGVTNANITLGQ